MEGFKPSFQIWGENKVADVPKKSVVEKVGDTVNPTAPRPETV